MNILGVAIFGFNEIGPKFIQGVFQAAALVIMFFTAKRIFGKPAAAISVIVASVYLSSPLIAKYGNVKEEFMTAVMIIGICLVALRHTGGKWYLSFLAGAVLIWAPLFKPTGMSAIGAVGLFVIVQPVLKNRTFKQTAIDILLLLAGAIASLAPLYIWLLGWDVKLSLPYSFVWSTISGLLPAQPAAGTATAATSYVSVSRRAVSLVQQASMVFRYYKVLILPIALAVGSIICRLAKLVLRLLHKSQDAETQYDKFVLLLGLWWIFDMVMVWVSPRPYEQYYIPLNGSAAMLGGYLIAVYCDKLQKSSYNRVRWQAIGFAGILVMIAMSWHIFFGISKSPSMGTDYGEKRRGYVQKWDEIARQKEGNLKGYWEVVGDYIRQNSVQTDRIYVWGWIPAIYVKAQRFSSAAAACTSEMHVNPPAVLSDMVKELLSDFAKRPPKFIVDTHNKHFPYDIRPPLELWPSISNGIRLLDKLPEDREQLLIMLLRTFNVGAADLTKEGLLRPDPAAIERYDTAYEKILREKVEPDEALRFEAMKPLRDYIMNNYRLAQILGDECVFERNTAPAAPAAKEAQ